MFPGYAPKPSEARLIEDAQAKRNKEMQQANIQANDPNSKLSSVKNAINIVRSSMTIKPCA